MDLSVFDEAHNVHTPKRYFLFGVPKPQNLSESDSDDDDFKEEYKEYKEGELDHAALE